MKIIHKQARKNAFTRHQKVKYIFLLATILKHMYRYGKVSCWASLHKHWHVPRPIYKRREHCHSPSIIYIRGFYNICTNRVWCKIHSGTNMFLGGQEWVGYSCGWMAGNFGAALTSAVPHIFSFQPTSKCYGKLRYKTLWRKSPPSTSRRLELHNLIWETLLEAVYVLMVSPQFSSVKLHSHYHHRSKLAIVGGLLGDIEVLPTVVIWGRMWF